MEHHSIEVNLVDADNIVKEVELYANGTLIGSKTAPPFTYEWNTKEVNDGGAELKVIAKSEKR
ncbi:MAG: hypothetical protein HC831_06575 [Chloroflexia bacterium]|nr:hypothetical protein [Chloroflexia bacterium]